MTTYRHCTNLAKPYSNVDANFLAVLGDYKEGDPVSPDPVAGSRWTPRTVDQMKADGIVGIYTTASAIGSRAVRNLTNWQNPSAVLGTELPNP